MISWAKAKRTVQRPQFRFGLLVLVPIVAWYVLFSFRPVVTAFRMSVIDYKLLDPASSVFVGLQHFETLFTKYELFWTASLNTLKYALLVNLGMLPLAMLFAYCISYVARGRNWYQWALFLPVVVSMAAVALMFRFLMDPDVGILNHILRSVGLPVCRWFTGPTSAMYSIVAVDIWKVVGVYTVLLSAGLLSVPDELYDAAKVDGANAWQIFWRVTLPLMSHTLKLVAILVTIGALQVYVSANILTRGGPGYATYMISEFVLGEAFTNLRFGLASAAAFVLFVVILVVTLFQLRLMRTEWEY